jgi:FixJ family two-component response regulator
MSERVAEHPEATEVAAASSRDPTVGLAAVASLRRLLESLEELQVANARARGWSWQQIADALAVSKQAVHKKYRRSGFSGGAMSNGSRRRPARSSCWPNSGRASAGTTRSTADTCCVRWSRCPTTWP